MDELCKDFIPKVCWGCYENCFKCNKQICGVSTEAIRRLATTRIMKLQAISRMQKDVVQIEGRINRLLSESSANNS